MPRFDYIWQRKEITKYASQLFHPWLNETQQQGALKKKELRQGSKVEGECNFPFLSLSSYVQLAVSAAAGRVSARRLNR